MQTQTARGDGNTYKNQMIHIQYWSLTFTLSSNGSTENLFPVKYLSSCCCFFAFWCFKPSMQPELNSTQTQPSCVACFPSLQPSLPVALLGPQLDSKIFIHILLLTGHHMLLVEHNAVPLPARVLHGSLLSSLSLDYTTLTSARGVRKIMNRFPPDPWPQLPVL